MMDLLNEKLKKLADSIMGGMDSQHGLLESKDEFSTVEQVGDNGQLTKFDSDFIDRIKNRIKKEEIENQINLESILELADQDLEGNKGNNSSDKEVDDNWFQMFTNFAKAISNEDMRKLFAKILAGEIRNPDSFSLRTLDFLRLLSRKEAEIIRKMAQYVVYESTGRAAYILNSKTTEEVKISDIMLLKELGLMDNSQRLALTINRNGDKEFNVLLMNKTTGLFLNTEKDDMIIHIYKLTNMGMEIMKLNDDVEVNVNYLKESAEYILKNDSTMSITCAPILNLTDDNVDLDEEQAYFKIGKKFDEKG